MVTFGKYIFWLLLIVIGLLSLLDYGYTYVYNHGAYRNKAMWVRDMQEQPKLDYIILGSSRAKYFVDPRIVASQTGKHGLNLGVNASTGIEIYLMLEEFLSVRSTDTVFVQVDSKYIEDDPDLVGEQIWIPYIREQEKYDMFKDQGAEYVWCRYVPFYRYQRSEARLGYRNVLPSMLGKGVDYDITSGYVTKSGVITKERPYIADQPITKENPYFKMMIDMCKEKNIDLIFFTAPIYGFEGDLEPLKTYLPNYTDLKDCITDRELFSDQTHLNTEGAKVFSEIFSDVFFENKSSK